MSKFKVILGWVGIVLLGLAHGILEDLMFIRVLVEYMPPNWDLTGNLFFVFTVPLAQLRPLQLPGPWLGVFWNYGICRNSLRFGAAGSLLVQPF
jgi:hypothetical protein